jgi:formylglycine-generating enzyme required for sulfatase activity
MGQVWYCVKDFHHDGEGKACNLKEFLARHNGMLSPYQVFHIITQILAALDYAANYIDAHHQGVSHGNLKLENILLSAKASRAGDAFSFDVLLSDFQPYGLFTEEIITSCYQQWLDLQKELPSRISEKMIQQGLQSLFTPFDYRAPEAVDGTQPTPSQDIYSVGVLIYEMLTGALPSGTFPIPSELRPELSEHWDHIVMRCLQVKPSKRYPTIATFLEDLKENIKEEVDTIPSAPVVQVKKERHSLTPPGMVYIPSGTFFVGGAECGEDALPQHQCSSEGFYIDRTPVTNGQFTRFIEESGYETEAEEGKGAPIWTDGQWRVLEGISWRNPLAQNLPEEFDQHPVTQVTLRDVNAYAEWLGRRLPTEEEWEYAARGGQKDARFPWGNTISRTQANYASDGTSSVMQHQANGYGLYDMAGNVWEWTASWYLPYPGNERENPHFGEKYRVVRGGAWLYDGSHCMSSYRNANQPENAYPTLGFRTAADFSA